MADEKKAAKAAKDEEPDAPVTPDAKAAKKKEKKDEKKESKKKTPEVKKGDYGADFRYIVRISNTDLDGTKTVKIALTGIKGVGHRMAHLVAVKTGIDPTGLMGDLKDEQIESVQKAVDSLAEFVPAWAVNRPYDVESGDDLHLVGQGVEIMLRDDLNRLKKIRSYKGVRHEAGLPVRGQRTRANGRTGLTVGVQRAKAQAAAAGTPETKEEKK
jgi:small subunit ribosomal protein S13